MSFWDVLAVLAANEQAPAGGGNNGPLIPYGLLLPLVAVFILYQFVVVRPQRREQAKRDEIIKSLKKNDPVVTIGGIIGTVVSVSEDG